MEIVNNKALLVRTKNPDKITSYIEKSRVVEQIADGVFDVLVHWDLVNTKVLQNLGFKKAPSPIETQYKFPGIYKPFEHQKTTAAFMTLHQRAFCFNEQGTGKTASIAWAADYLMTHGYIKRVLIICPLSIMDAAWRADLFKTLMHRRVDIAHSSSREKRIKVIESNAEFVIINPDGVESVRDEIALGGFDMIVIDECTSLKNPTTRRWKVINSLVRQDTWLWMLTGTPAAQSPMDAYGLAKIMNPKSVPSFIGAFRDKVMNKVTQFKYAPKPEAQQIVHNILQPAIRFTKEECLDLPEILYTDRNTPLTVQQKKYYSILKAEMLIQTDDEDISAVNAAVNMNKLLQISSGAVYTDTGRVMEFDCGNKLAEMLAVVQETSHKTLVFCNFKHSIDIVQTYLTKHKITSEAVHGGVAAKKRAEIFTSFQTESKIQVLVIQPQAAAHGVTLHAANSIVWFGPVTSAEIYLQANARVHRAGQKNPCTVVHLVSSPVEKRLYRALQDRTLAQGSLLDMYKQEVQDGIE
jgi:SNF2 family DNA or RNA helicase